MQLFHISSRISHIFHNSPKDAHIHKDRIKLNVDNFCAMLNSFVFFYFPFKKIKIAKINWVFVFANILLFYHKAAKLTRGQIRCTVLYTLIW